MSKTTIINHFGTLIGWNAITLNIFGRDVEGITEIAYSDTVEWSNEKGANMFPIGEGQGDYEAKASITLYEEEVRAIEAALPKVKRIQDALADITVAYEVDAKVYVDVIHNVRIKTRGVDAKQGDKKLTQKLELKTSHITWNK